MSLLSNSNPQILLKDLIAINRSTNLTNQERLHLLLVLSENQKHFSNESAKKLASLET